jgi:hypothetical protein
MHESSEGLTPSSLVDTHVQSVGSASLAFPSVEMKIYGDVVYTVAVLRHRSNCTGLRVVTEK